MKNSILTIALTFFISTFIFSQESKQQRSHPNQSNHVKHKYKKDANRIGRQDNSTYKPDSSETQINNSGKRGENNVDSSSTELNSFGTEKENNADLENNLVIPFIDTNMVTPNNPSAPIHMAVPDNSTMPSNPGMPIPTKTDTDY